MPPNQLTPEQLAAARARVALLAHWLDAAIRIPGTRFRFGFDAIVGLVPMIGDLVGLLLSAWLIIDAVRLGAPGTLILRMLFNLSLDALVGLVPLLGDLFDATYKANLRNARLLERHLERHGEPEPLSRAERGLGIGLLLLLVAAIAAVAVRVFDWALATI